MWERSKRPLSAAALVGAFVLLSAAPAFAHESRKLGHLEMEVGWGTEPAFAGEVNSVQVLLVHDEQPVVDLGDTLDLEVTFGQTTTPMTLEPFFGEGEGTPGDYRAWFIPTSAGRYTFHLSGTVDGENVDETFTSGPNTFDDVESPQSVEFPEQQPTSGELADRLDRVEPRLASAIGDAQADAQAAADDASSAKTFGLIGILVGLIGLIVAIVALVSTADQGRLSPMLAHAGGAPEFVSTGLVGLGFVTGWIGLSRLRGRGFGSLPRWSAIGLVAMAPVILVASVVVPSRVWPPPAAIRPTSTATIAFAQPTPGEAETGATMEVRLDLRGGTIVPSSTTTLTPATGHIHVFVDGAIVSMTYGKDQRIPIGDLAPGPHRLQVEFVAADHAPFAPRVTASVVFVKEPA